MKPAALIGKYGGFSSTGHFGVWLFVHILWNF
jgi:hypothetical protein